MNIKAIITNCFVRFFHKFVIAPFTLPKNISQLQQCLDGQIDLTNEKIYRLSKILKFAQKHNPYYHKILENKTITPNNAINILKSMPLLSKDIIRENGKNIISSSALFTGNISTGGSTGEPLVFPVSPNYELLHQSMLYNIMGYTNNDLIVSFSGLPISEKNKEQHIYWNKKSQNLPYGKYIFSTLEMTESALPYYIQALNKLNPKFFRGYTSGIVTIAKFVKDSNCKISFNLKGIYLTSENITHNDMKLLQDVFHCDIYGQYGHSEVSIFAITKPNSLRYYCSPLYGYTEILNEHGEHVKEGEIGEIIVTGFSNKIMPFIRYKTGDLGIYAGTHNGVTIIDELLGRTADYIYNNNNEKVYLAGLNHSLAKINMIQFQITQNTIGEININIVPASSFSQQDETDIISLFQTNKINVNIKYNMPFIKTKRGKQKVLIQNIN